MDRGKRPVRAMASRNCKMYMDFKDILRENMLQFLPAKSLFRFRSICRDWKLQISSPFFGHSQSYLSRSVVGFFYQKPNEQTSLVSVEHGSCGVPDPSLGFLPGDVELKSSSNGLLLCQGKSGNRPYYVCNPVLKQWKQLPEPNANHGPNPAIVLVFEPSVLNFEIEYKAICAFPSNDFDDATEFEIYSSKQGSWKVSGEICFCNLELNPKSGIYAKGVVYWRGKRLLAYDLSMDRSQMHNQYYISSNDNNIYACVMGTLHGELCTASFNGQTLTVNRLGNVHKNTMQMHNGSSMWKNVVSVNMDNILGVAKSCNWSVYAVSGTVALIGCDQKLFSYDFKKKEQKAVVSGYNCHGSILVPYVNSLASLEF